ncbi:hypothetical protein AB1A65_07125 [Muricauda sp. ANG21]|uniref:hypothetical protein n=1 Tax=Allomuricauda sp. ANG21 TaxID=3042468 RepID=UPI003454C680
MKRFLIILITPCYFSYSQTNHENLEKQLEEMNECFLQKDMKCYVSYLHPFIVEVMGGKETAVKTFTNKIASHEENGKTFISLEHKEHSEIIEYNGELQCSLTQVSLIELENKGKMIRDYNGKILYEYTIIAVTADNGENWKFIETTGKEDMISHVPNISPKLPVKKTTRIRLD